MSADRTCLPRFLLAFALFATSNIGLSQVITTVAGFGVAVFPGDGGPATSAGIDEPQGIATDNQGDFFFYDSVNQRLREVNTSGVINTVAGNGNVGLGVFGNLGDGGPATSASFGSPGTFAGVAFDAAGNLYISDPSNNRVRKVDTGGIISTFAGNGFPASAGDGGQATSASISQPAGIVVDGAGNLYIADWASGRVRKVNPQGIISTYAGGGSGGDGPATSASLLGPIGLALDSQGNLYISEGLGTPQRVRMVNTSGTITTVAGGNGPGFSGDGGPATKAQLFEPQGLAVDSAGNLYIADFQNNRVRKVDTSGTITTIAGAGHIDGYQNIGSANNGDGGNPVNASLQPSGLALDAAGNLYISDYTGYRVRKIAFGKAPQGLYSSASSMYFATSSVHTSAASQLLTIGTLGAPISFNITSTTQSGGNWLSLNQSGTTPQTITVSLNNGLGLGPGTYNGTLTITPTTPGYSPIMVQVTFVLSANLPATPVITDVQNGASFQSGYASNAIWTIKGTNLASTTDTWNNSIVNGVLPTSLDGVTATFNGYPAYISYISPTQINILTPDAGDSGGSLFVTNNGSASSFFNAQGNGTPYSPAFFLWPNNQAVATRTDYTYAVAPGTFPTLTTVSAKPGEVIILWGTGFGPTTPPTQPGVNVPTDQTYSTSNLPTVTINGVQATVYGAALAPGFAGLYQVAIQVPTTLPNGEWPIVATISGGIDQTQSSPSGTMLSVHN